MDKLKESFSRVKEDVESLYKEVDSIKENLETIRREMVNICEILKKLTQYYPTHKPLKKTSSTHPSTHNLPLEPLKSKNMAFSTGNQGVPTDRQTDRQTDKQPLFSLKKPEIQALNSIDNAAKILDSLDNIKKEIRLKFKRLTDQELLVFSTLYQLDEETGPVEYKTLAKKLNLTESSIRDYIGRLIKKGIPVEKKRINNKIIHLSISKNLKKIASLSTILQLRDL